MNDELKKGVAEHLRHMGSRVTLEATEKAVRPKPAIGRIVTYNHGQPGVGIGWPRCWLRSGGELMKLAHDFNEYRKRRLEE